MHPENSFPGQPLHLLKTQIFHGPNPWALAPVVVCALALSNPAVAPRQIWQALKDAFPDWAFLEPAVHPDRPATNDAAHWMAQWAMEWALAALNEVRGVVRDGGVKSLGPGRAVLWLGFHRAEVTLAAVRLGIDVVGRAARPDALRPEVAAATELQKLWATCRRWHPDYQARILMTAAHAMEVPVLPFGKDSSRLWQYGWGQRSRVFAESRSNEDGVIGHQVAASKASSKEFLGSLGFPCAAHVLVSTEEELPAAAATVGWPCVAKPLDRGGGKGVTAGIRDLEDLLQAFAHARAHTQGPVMVEAFIAGDDHRLMVIDGRMVSATRRDPPTVVGDGHRSVRALIDALNQTRTANLIASQYRLPVHVDSVVLARLRQQGLDLEDVPGAGQRVWLRSNSNMSTGGSCADVTERVHPAVRRLAESIAATLGLATCGVDYLTTDISRPWQETGGGVIEFNTTPGIDVAIAGGMDELEVGRQVLGALPGRLPVVLVLAPESVQTTWRPALATAAAGRPGMAWLCADASGVGDLPIALTGALLHERTATLLRNRLTAALLVVCTARELQQQGLPVDRLGRVILCQQDLPAPWMEVLGAVASTVDRADDPAAAWRACTASL